MHRLHRLVALVGVVFAGVVVSPCAAEPRSTAQPKDVWLDVDTTNGYVADGRPHDDDDGLAILLAIHSPELTVRGVSTIFGNGPLDVCQRVAEEILSQFGPEGLKHAYPGAESGKDLGKETDATRALEAELMKRPLTVLALGPVTNVATVVQLHPELRQNISQVIFVGARRPGFGFHPPGRPELVFPDANFEKDVPGTQVLLDSGVPIVFAGYEVSSDVWVTRADVEKLKAENACGEWIARTSDAWLQRWERVQKLKGMNPFDTLAVAYAIDPNLLTGIGVTAHITTGPDDRATDAERAAGKTKPYLICEPSDKPTNFVYLTSTKPAFLPLLLGRLTHRAE